MLSQLVNFYFDLAVKDKHVQIMNRQMWMWPYNEDFFVVCRELFSLQCKKWVLMMADDDLERAHSIVEHT